MGKTIVGVDISASGIRAAELDGAIKARPVLVRYHAVALPAGAVNKGEVVEARTVATALKTLWSQGKFGTKDIVLGVGNSRVLARDLTVPKLPIAQVRESLQFHVQDMLPYPSKDALLDFYPITEGVDASGPVLHGLLVAALKSAVVGNVDAAKLAGLNPVNVDLVPFALTRVLLRGARGAGTAAMIDIGASTTTVVISSNGVPQFVRIIANGGGDLTAALSSRLGMPPETAEQTKRAIGLSNTQAPRDGQDPSGVIYEVTGQLITSLRDTLTYYSTARPGDIISRVVLSGGGSALRGFGDALSEYTRLQVTMGDPFESVTIGRQADKTIRQIGADSSLSVAIGLAMGNAA